MQPGRRWRDHLPDPAPAIIVAVAVGLRALWVLLVPSKPVGDFAMYLESAAHLHAHGALDPEFVYMPGYVALAAAVFAAGGGLLAVKLVGAALAGAAAGAIYGISAALADRRSALVAAGAYALWPAGIAVTSVTGTDMPSAALLLLCLWALVKLTAGQRRWTAAVVFGGLMGLGAYLRAVTVPLAGFDLFFWRAQGDSWRRAAARAALSGAVALVVLAPWGLRNQARYGQWFLTDSHGGLTALVGANPNSEGRYSRSLNLVFRKVTGYTLLAEPHREADRAAYALTRQLTAFSPAYAAGLVAQKAGRLLGPERALLYWPIYRAGVLQPGPVAAFWGRQRPVIEKLVDATWLVLVAGTVAGLGIALRRRHWQLLAFVPMQLALVGMYALYFAEIRYRLPIAALMFPLFGYAVAALSYALTPLSLTGTLPLPRTGRGDRSSVGTVSVSSAALRPPAPSPRPRGEGSQLPTQPVRRDLMAALLALAVVAIAWPSLQWAGERLRARHRFAAHACEAHGQQHLCMWASGSAGDSLVRGVHDGVGLTVAGVRVARSQASMTVPGGPLPAGPLEVRAAVDLVPAPRLEAWASPGEAQLLANGKVIARAPLPALAVAGASGQPVIWQGTLAHPGGPLHLELRADTVPALAPAAGLRSTLWLWSLSVRARP